MEDLNLTEDQKKIIDTEILRLKERHYDQSIRYWIQATNGMTQQETCDKIKYRIEALKELRG